VATIPILDPGLIHQAEVGLVDQTRRAQSVILALDPELPMRHPAELLIDQGEQPVERGLIPRA